MDIIDHIYIIHLKKSLDRRKHLIQEFSKFNLNKYTFFEAVTETDEIIDRSLKSQFIKIHPHCFRCKKKHCSHSNRILSRSQIANFFSFIRLMEKISQINHEGLVMICEDDISFQKNFLTVLNTLIGGHSFARLGIEFNKPILIQLSYFNPLFRSKWIPQHLSKIKLMSNPYFIIIDC